MANDILLFTIYDLQQIGQYFFNCFSVVVDVVTPEARQAPGSSTDDASHAISEQFLGLVVDFA
jgi:hypothetical protein